MGAKREQQQRQRADNHTILSTYRLLPIPTQENRHIIVLHHRIVDLAWWFEQFERQIVDARTLQPQVALVTVERDQESVEQVLEFITTALLLLRQEFSLHFHGLQRECYFGEDGGKGAGVFGPSQDEAHGKEQGIAFVLFFIGNEGGAGQDMNIVGRYTQGTSREFSATGNNVFSASVKDGVERVVGIVVVVGGGNVIACNIIDSIICITIRISELWNTTVTSFSCGGGNNRCGGFLCGCPTVRSLKG